MKLYAKKVGDPLTAITEIDSFMDDDLGGDAPFVKTLDGDPAPTDYQELTTIKDWVSFGGIAHCDFKVIRKALQGIYAGGAWATATNDEKLLLCQFYACTTAHMLEVLTPDEILSNGVEFHRHSKESRSNRVLTSEAIIYAHLNLVDAFTLISAIKVISENYVEYGVEGHYSSDGVDGLFDYFYSTTGSSYEGAGFAESGIVPSSGATLVQVRDLIMNITEHGYY